MRILFTSAGGLGQYRPDLVVSECLEFAGSMVAERAGIPSVSAQIGSFAIDDPQAGPIIDELNHRRRSIGLPASDRLPWHSMPVANWLPELMRCAEPPFAVRAVRLPVRGRRGPSDVASGAASRTSRPVVRLRPSTSLSAALRAA